LFDLIAASISHGVVSMSLGSTSWGSGVIDLSNRKVSLPRFIVIWNLSDAGAASCPLLANVSSVLIASTLCRGLALLSSMMPPRTSGACVTQHLCPLAFGAAVTNPAQFLGLDFLDKRVVAAEGLPSGVVKMPFFSYGFFAQYVLGVPAAVGDELLVILGVCRLAMM
jgi:hypothetical protein